MDFLYDLVQRHAEIAPLVVFALLLLAGMNVPVSEDAVVIGSAFLAVERPDLLPSLLLAVGAGAYLGDLLCYGMGRRFGPSLWRLPGFERVLPYRHVAGVVRYYERYGLLTLLIGRFLPLGIRNAVLLTAGLSRVPFARVALVDLVAASASCGAYFWLCFRYGSVVVEQVAESQFVLLGIVTLVVAFVILRRRALRAAEGAPIV